MGYLSIGLLPQLRSGAIEVCEWIALVRELI